jgi:molybdate transport system substrate-binding protein
MLILAAFCALFIGATHLACAQETKELRVAAAADLQPVLPVLAADYEKATGVKLAISFGSSGNLATQIINGAPMDLFLGADFVFPEKIVAAGLADSNAPTPYAKGTLVLWARKDSPLQPITLDSLVDKRVTTVAIANDLHAPYGQAAVMAMRRMKVYDAVKPHLVIAENIAQAAQFVESGNAQLGLISLTAASSQRFKDAGSYVLVPTQTYTSIRQCAVVMAKSDRKAIAHAFLDWLLSSPVQERLPQMGLGSVR